MIKNLNYKICYPPKKHKWKRLAVPIPFAYGAVETHRCVVCGCYAEERVVRNIENENVRYERNSWPV